jgi:signal transduction histidine kinase/CheY-like chemotaxis protein
MNPDPARSQHESWRSIGAASSASSELEARALSLATINAIADTVYRYLDLATLVEHTVDVILKYIPVESVILFMLHESGQWLDAAAWRGFDDETLKVGSRLPITGSATGITVTQKEISTEYAIVENEQIEPHVKQELLRQGMTGFISVPLLFQEHAVGALNLIFHEKHTLTPLEHDTLMAIGKTIGLAMVNAQHVNRIEAEIQERRRVEAELRLYQEHLEELVAGRTAELEAANRQLQDAQQRAERASQAKTIFLSNMSHELRTPLNVIIGYTSSMLNQSPIYNNVKLPAIYSTDIQLVFDNSYYLLGLINDVLDLSKIEAGKFVLNFAPVALPDIFNGVMATARGLVQDKPLQLRLDVPDNLPFIWADAVRIRQILLNLLSNAIKFTSTGNVTLQAEIVHDERDSVRIAVIDTGIGIPADALPFVFDRFQQASQETSGQYGGTGLGLDICNQLTRLHGGHLTASSTVGEGSTFSLTLPIAADQTTPVAMPGSDKHGSIRIFQPSFNENTIEPALILVITSTHGQAQNEPIQSLLESAGYLVLMVYEMAQAIGMARDLIPDLIVLNGVDRQALAETLNGNLETAAIPIVAWPAADTDPVPILAMIAHELAT